MHLLNWLRQTITFSYRSYLFAKRNLFFLFELFFWPIIGVISLGLMSRFLALNQEMMSFILTGIITMNVLQITQLDVSYSLFYDIWSKSVKHTFSTPISVSNVIIGGWLFGILRGFVIYAILTIISLYMFNFRIPTITTMLIFLCGTFLSALLVGICVCVLILLFGQRAEAVAWALSPLLMLICGVYYPVTIFPPILQTVAYLIPLTYFLEYFRASYIVTTNNTTGTMLQRGFTLTIIYLLLFYFCLILVVRHARKTGLFLRLSE